MATFKVTYNKGGSVKEAVVEADNFSIAAGVDVVQFRSSIQQPNGSYISKSVALFTHTISVEEISS